MNIDDAYTKAEGIILEAERNIANIKSEEDSKFQIISRLLTEVLGWSHSDVGSERANENGFSDYLVCDEQRPAFVVEAKKVGVLTLNTQASKEGAYKISGPVLKGALPGIEQAASYCHPQGIQLATVTDGMLWIVFLPWVPQANYKERQAILFPTLQSILDDFTIFYELLSKAEYKKGTYKVIFDSIHENRLLLDRGLASPISQDQNGLVQKSALAFDIDNVFSKFFSKLGGEEDPEMLVNCFVESRESRVADFSLERITRNVLGNLHPDLGVEEGLETLVASTVEGAEQGQTIFIVGPPGAGKTTFLKRFFTKTLGEDVRSRCVVININALDATGNESSALTWVTEQAINAIEHQIYAAGYPLWDDLLGLYHLEYLKRSNGIDAQLYTKDKEAFKEKFAAYIEQQVASDREGYLKRLIKDLVKNRKKLPIFVIDNTDEHLFSFKAAIFQQFQALRRSVDYCLLIFPATDRSAWTFSKTEIFNIYSSRSFFLPTPSPREVFGKRIEYLNNKISLPDQTQSAAYLAGRGIKVTIKDLGAFARVVESVFVDQDYAARMVGELSNYNMRNTLKLARRVITSSVLKIEDLIRTYVTGDMVAPSALEFMNALMKGDYEFFRPGDEPLLYTLFQVDSRIRQSPLLNSRILLQLKGLHYTASEDADRYITVESLMNFFGLMSISETAVAKAIDGLLSASLIEPYDLSTKEYSAEQRISITHSGLAHLTLATYNPVYFGQMALTTRIPDEDVARQIRGAYGASGGISSRMEEIRDIFCKYLVDEDARHCSIPDRQEYSLQKELENDLVGRWQTRSKSAAEMMKQPETVAEAVFATVETFNHSRGFGFVDIPEIREKAFVHARAVEQSGIVDALFDGDEILCDVVRTDKGLSVSKIHEVQASESPAYKAKIVKLLGERGYGFAHIEETGGDAFFHYHVFTPEQQPKLAEGMTLLIEVKTDKRGRSQVRRILSVDELSIPAGFDALSLASPPIATGS